MKGHKEEIVFTLLVVPLINKKNVIVKHYNNPNIAKKIYSKQHIYLQVGTLAGNLSTKHVYPRFPSDLFTIYETVGAQLLIGELFIFY